MRGEIRSPRAEVAVIAAGMFATTLGWPSLLARYSIGLHLKNQLGLGPEQVALFWAAATFAWCGKPLIGLACDALGATVEDYLSAGTLVAALLWVTMAIAPPRYGPLLALTVGLVVTFAVMSTALGAMLVAAGQRAGATGRLSSLRQGLVGLAALVAGPLGGWLATESLPVTGMVGLGLMLSLRFVLVSALRAQPREGEAIPRAAAAQASARTAVTAEARRHLAAVVRSRDVRATAGLLFLAYLAPSLQTPLLYYQVDVLGWSPQLIGTLQVPGAAGSLAGAAAYALLCRRLPLRQLLPLGVAFNVAATLLYLAYRSPATAAAIAAAAGVLGTLALLPLYDLAARAAPRGSEAFGFALLMSVQALASLVLSDVVGAWLYHGAGLGWRPLVLVNAAWTAAVALYLPLVPRALTAAREGSG